MKTLFWAIVLFVVVFLSCKKDSNYDAFATYVTYTYTDTANILADDTSMFTVTITTKAAQDSSYFVPSFPAAGGKILGIDSGANVYIVNNTATFQVQVTQAPGLYPLNLQYQTNKLSFVQTNILTRPALPDYLLVEASALSIDTSTFANVAFTVVPKRYKGAVSNGYSVSARAYQVLSPGDTVDDSHFVGLANNVVSAGQISIGFVPDKATLFAGPIYVQFYSITNQGTITSTIYTLSYP